MVQVPDILEIIKYVILGIFTSTTQIFILIVCIYFYRKMGSSIERFLLLLGSLLSFLFSILAYVATLTLYNYGAETYEAISYISHFGSFIGNVLFAIGFLIMVKKVVRYNIKM